MIPRKYVILIVGLVIFLIAVAGSAYFFKEYKNVTFTIDYPEATATISEAKGQNKSFATISDRSSMWLKKQTYTIQFSGDKLSHTPVSITVDDKTKTIALDPNLSTQLLQQTLRSEKPAIDAVVKQSITSSSPYTVEEERLYHRGEWYSAAIKLYQSSSSDPDIGNPDNVDTLSIVLKKDGSAWKLVAKPSLIITKPDYPHIPTYIIDAINPVRSYSAS